MNIEALTLWLAVWGAIVGTVSLGWHIYQGVIDRGRLRVQCSIGRFAIVPVAFFPEGDRPTEPRLVYTITNVGRRPIFVTKYEGGHKDGTYFVVVPQTTPWPKELKPGESIHERAEDPVKVLLARGGGVKFLGAWDSTGKLYRDSFRNLRRLIAQAKKLGDGIEGRKS